MEPGKNSNSEVTSSRRTLRKLKSTTKPMPTSNSASTTSQPGPMRNTNPSSVTSQRCNQNTNKFMTDTTSQPINSRTPSTGFPKVLSLVLRTKDNADHAGHSHPPVPLKVLNSSTEPRNLLPSQNNNSLTAQPETTVAEEDQWVLPSSMLRRTHSREKKTMHTLPRMDHADMKDQWVLPSSMLRRTHSREK